MIAPIPGATGLAQITEIMPVRYARVLLLCVAFIVTPSGLRADPDNYPRACVDASAVADAARGYSQNTAAYKWDFKKLQTAYNEYQSCISAATDADDLGYAVTGMIYVDLLQSAYYRDFARSAALVLPHESLAQRHKLFDDEKRLAYSYLADAKHLIDKANGPGSGLNSDTMATIDKQYEDYKKSYALVASLSYADSVRYVAQLQRLATGSSKPHPTTAPLPASSTVPTCAAPDTEARILSAAQPELPPIAAQQGISGDVVVRVSLDETGRIISATIVKSPSALLNGAALSAARNSTFKAATASCLPTPGTVQMTVHF